MHTTAASVAATAVAARRRPRARSHGHARTSSSPRASAPLRACPLGIEKPSSAPTSSANGGRSRRTSSFSPAPAADPTSIVAATTSAVRRRPSRQASRQPTATSARIVQGCIATATTSPASTSHGWAPTRRSKAPWVASSGPNPVPDGVATRLTGGRPRPRRPHPSARGPDRHRGRRRACGRPSESPTASTRTCSAPGSTRTSSRDASPIGSPSSWASSGVSIATRSRRSRQCSTRLWPRALPGQHLARDGGPADHALRGDRDDVEDPVVELGVGHQHQAAEELAAVADDDGADAARDHLVVVDLHPHPHPVAVELGQARDHVRHRADLGLEALRGVGHDLGVEAEARPSPGRRARRRRRPSSSRRRPHGRHR